MCRRTQFLLMMLCSSIPAVGQIEEDSAKVFTIDEVVITATRTERKIVDVPYAVERISQNEYRFDRKVAVDDALETVPGLFLQSRYGNHDVRITMRGFGSRSNSGIRGVRILLDGIPESEPDGQTRIEAIDFHSVGSIEVVRGNSSSLYTNAPGGVINFLSDLSFDRSYGQLFSDAGSFGLSSSGFKLALRSDRSRFVTSYNYHSARGYRQHSEDDFHILNSAYETMPTDRSSLRLYGYYADGLIRLPGSLTRSQFDADPFQPNRRDAGRDVLRLTRKGRLGIEYDALFGEGLRHEVSFTGYATLKYFDRTARTYRIFNRSGIGSTARYILRTAIGALANEFTLGTDLFYQSGPIEEYDNIGGTKGDILSTLTNEAIGNTGVYALNTLFLVPDRLSLTLSGRYERVLFDTKNQILGVQNATRTFEAWTPKAALNWKIAPTIAVFSSYGLGFDTPAGNELDNYPTSSNPNRISNPDLQPQKSKNFEIGVKGSVRSVEALFFPSLRFDAVLFHTIVDDEIVPFEVLGDVFYRNAARTTRRGVELGVQAEIIAGVQVRTAYTFSDFRYDDYIARTLTTDTSGSLIVRDENFTGSTLPSVPKHNFSCSLSLEHPFTPAFSGFGKIAYISTSGLYADDRNSESTSGYELVNATAGVDWLVGRYDLLLSCGVNNLLDRVYAGFININSTTSEFYEAGEPRNFFASVSIGYLF